MATSDIDKVLAMFRGMAIPDPDLATKWVKPVGFKQHNPHVADGVEGLRKHIGRFPEENHHLKVVRKLQDGPFVFTHRVGLLLHQGVFLDIFKFGDGLIVEHWMFSTKGAPPNESGHTQTDGPTEAKDLEHTEKNKSLVRDYYQNIHIAGDHRKIPNYFSGDHCIRHEPGVHDGVAAFTRDLAELVKHRSIDEIKFLFGQGDFVFIAAKGSHELTPCVYIDLYRVENEKIAERWGFSEDMPPQAEWKNNNGML